MLISLRDGECNASEIFQFSWISVKRIDLIFSGRNEECEWMRRNLIGKPGVAGWNFEDVLTKKSSKF